MKFAIAWLIAINPLTFVLFSMDKARARRGAWRFSERALILCAVFGGSVGAMLGLCVFRHKTKKRKFTVGLPVIFIAQLAAAVWLLLR